MMTLDKAIAVMKAEVKDPYARNYLEAIPEAVEFGGENIQTTAQEALETQIRYALCNTRTWRGESARECKQFLRGWLKQCSRERKGG